MKKEQNYEPFGDEWKAEMMKMRKADIIEFYKKALEQRPEVSDGDIVKERERLLQIHFPVFSQIDAENKSEKRYIYGLAFESGIEWFQSFRPVRSIQPKEQGVKAPSDIMDFLWKLRFAEHEGIRTDSIYLFKKYMPLPPTPEKELNKE